MAVFVLDKHGRPLMPCTEKRARLLLERGRARVARMVPFTIRLIDRLCEGSVLQPMRLKFDPGSKTTGVAITLDGNEGTKAVFFWEVVHKLGIKAELEARYAVRHNRRSRKTRYRKPRFLNRKRRVGWLPPSLEARVQQTMNAMQKIAKRCPVSSISVEHVKFDTQLMQNAGISGIEYQQGDLTGYEVREYLLEKLHRACAYCGAKDTPLEIEHIVPKSRGGSNRVSNLTLACREYNQKKGSRTAEEFGYLLIQAQANKPLKDAAMMNATRWRLYEQLRGIGPSVECGTGARTKMQRIQHGLPKEHYYDALCVGASTPNIITNMPKYVQVWSATGRGSRQMCRTNKYGFPIAHRQAKKNHCGFLTGDLVIANIKKSKKYQGVWKGQVAVRASGYFDIKVHGKRIVQGVSHRYFSILQHADGWQYETKYISV